MNKKLSAVVISSVLFAAAPAAPAFAGGGPVPVPGATELTQIMNNFELVASVGQQAAANAKLIEQYFVQFKQLQNMIKNLATMDPAVITNLLGPSAQGAVQYLKAYQASVRLADAASNGYQMLNADIKGMRAGNLMPSQYYDRAAAAAASGSAYWKGQMQQNAAAIMNLQQANQAMIDLAAQNPNIDGTVKGLQLVSAQNTQLAQTTLQMSADQKQLLMIAQQRQQQASDQQQKSVQFESDYGAAKQQESAALRDTFINKYFMKKCHPDPSQPQTADSQHMLCSL